MSCLARLLVPVLFCLASVAAVGSSAAAAQAGNDRMLMGYYVGYQRDLMPPAEIEWSAMTHIAVGAVLPRPSGSLDLSFFLGPGEGRDFARDLAERAHANGVVPILMIGGAGTHDAFRAAASAENRKRFVNSIIRTMRDLGYDGLDLDWEPMNPADQKPFRALVTSLRTRLPNAVLTVPADVTTLTFPDVPRVFARVAPLLDRINLMSYGMEGAYPGWDSWHSSALYGAAETTPTSVEATVDHFRAAGVPAAKLGVGIGFFGDCWTGPVTGPRQPIGAASIGATDSEMSYSTIMASYYTAAAARFDATAQVPYLSFGAPMGGPGCRYITYENAASIAAKGAWALGQGLGGAIVWTINQGHDRSAPAGQRDALLRAARVAFGA
jgi:chitinase